MARTTCLVCPVSTVSDCCKLGRGSASSRHLTKLEKAVGKSDIGNNTFILITFKFPLPSLIKLGVLIIFCKYVSNLIYCK
jgi:hypothetical protein